MLLAEAKRSSVQVYSDICDIKLLLKLEFVIVAV